MICYQDIYYILMHVNKLYVKSHLTSCNVSNYTKNLFRVRIYKMRTHGMFSKLNYILFYFL